jgi:hypothetical protein
VLRRVISTVALLALVSTPVVARTRLFCRYTGVEITDCAEQELPGSAMVQVEGCCDRQLTRTLGVVLNGQQQEVAPPALHALPALSVVDLSNLEPPAHREHSAAVPAGPRVFLITRALLI